MQLDVLVRSVVSRFLFRHIGGGSIHVPFIVVNGAVLVSLFNTFIVVVVNRLTFLFVLVGQRPEDVYDEGDVYEAGNQQELGRLQQYTL